MKAREETSQNV